MISTLNERDPDDIRPQGDLLNFTEQIERSEPVLDDFVQAIESKRTVQPERRALRSQAARLRGSRSHRAPVVDR